MKDKGKESGEKKEKIQNGFGAGICGGYGIGYKKGTNE